MGKEEKAASIEKYFSERKNQKPENEDIKTPVKGEFVESKEATEGDEISKAEKELELAREKYVGANFETKSASDKIKKFLHVKDDLGDREALDLKYSKYKNKLNELLSLKIDELKSRNLGNNKIGKKINALKEDFDLEEEAKLNAVRAKFEPQQEKAPGTHEQVILEKAELVSKSLPDPEDSNLEFIFQGDKEKAMESFRSVISLGEEWENIKNMDFREATQKINWRDNNKVETIFIDIKRRLGNDAKPRKKETLEKWTERVAGLAIEKSQ